MTRTMRMTSACICFCLSFASSVSASSSVGGAAAELFENACLANWERPKVARAIFTSQFPQAEFETDQSESGSFSGFTDSVGLSVTPSGWALTFRETGEITHGNVVCTVSMSPGENGLTNENSGAEWSLFMDTVDAAIKKFDADAVRFEPDSPNWSFQLNGKQAEVGYFNDGCCSPNFFLHLGEE